MSSFVNAFRGEWLKRKRSFASSLVLGGSLFTPAVVCAIRLIHYRGLPRLYATDAFWQTMWRDCWESMAIFFLPLGAILATSLITQIEYKSNAWKQVHTLPVSMATVFLSKLAVILLMMVQFLVLFALGVYASAMLPVLLVPGVPVPKGSFWALPILKDSAAYFADSLPIVGAQYLIALRASNFLVPLGIGFMAWIGAVAAVSSRLAIWWPYSYTIIDYIKDRPKGSIFAAQHQLHWFAVIAFVLTTVVAYAMFVTKAEKG